MHKHPPMHFSVVFSDNLKGLFDDFEWGIHGTVSISGIQVTLKKSNFSIFVSAMVLSWRRFRGPPCKIGKQTL